MGVGLGRWERGAKEGWGARIQQPDGWAAGWVAQNLSFFPSPTNLLFFGEKKFSSGCWRKTDDPNQHIGLEKLALMVGGGGGGRVSG